MKMLSRSILAVALTGAFLLPIAASADVSKVVQAWRTDDGWLTELRKHTDGAQVCSAGKAFRDAHPFGLSIVQSGPMMLITLVDEASPPSAGGAMKFSADGHELGALSSTAAGPAFATAEQESGKTERLVSDLPDQLVTIDVADRHYQADMYGLAKARVQLKA